MRTRSTGLGKTELAQHITGLKPSGDYLIVQMETTEPVLWKVRAAATYIDIFGMIRQLVKPAVLWWIIKGLFIGIFTGFKRAKNPRPLDDF